MYYNDKGDVFGFLFRGYIKPSLMKIDHPDLIKNGNLSLIK